MEWRGRRREREREKREEEGEKRGRGEKREKRNTCSSEERKEGEVCHTLMGTVSKVYKALTLPLVSLYQVL